MHDKNNPGGKKRKKARSNPLPDYPLPDASGTALSTECTGLFPAPPTSDDELEAYRQMLTGGDDAR